MPLFGKSKKTSSKPTSPPLPPPQQQQQPYLQSPYSPYGNVAPQSSGYLGLRPSTAPNYGPQPQSWATSPPYQPVLVTQNYYLAPPPALKPKKSCGAFTKLNLGSVINLEVPPCTPGARIFNDGQAAWQNQSTQYLNQGVTLYDQICAKLDSIVTQIDGEIFSGDERELAVLHPQPPLWQQEQVPAYNQHVGQGRSKGMINNSVSTALTSTNYFAKVNLYANSRLPPDLPPMKLYMPTFPLLCLAAQYSERVYTKPGGQERETHVGADWRVGTKAMVIKSVPMDDMNTIVFAIRGTQTFMDWAVNLNSVPASPAGFLDDPGNLCHAGFLTVAKKLVEPVAARLEFLIQEDPRRCKCSLLITGHSAGGAVAALLYSHMLSTSPETKSKLSELTSLFKRIHCVTFGAPPVSLLPLKTPDNSALRKSLFLSFVNEGDPVTRADKPYVRSLLDLYSAPVPGQSCLITEHAQKLQPLVSNFGGKSGSSLTINKIRPPPKKSKSYPPPTVAPNWPVPVATLSNAGFLVLLRGVERYTVGKSGRKKPIQERMNEGVVVQKVTDEELRRVIWGDPVCHMMQLYARRIQILATNAVVGRG